MKCNNCEKHYDKEYIDDEGLCPLCCDIKTEGNCIMSYVCLVLVITVILSIFIAIINL